ncbi:hypothetical protein N5C96_26905 [Delftia tsuruhatensis]|uniref:hypothetical protein n=1 Tax=Delftia tsuruhatensis TaxID=180282 RepID=UPI002444D4FA|nr:hypothetical protein [Delftia tsuruhatensis]MDH0777051.1 hypothetical protein [Delftia tsuruhatensis]MDH1460618.1 hypothetical protein [Delftia tsuruhatensis]MDH1826655.1 hypothetical protein [Delftia tsuruhatensis]WGG13807.1 hypothetical protein N5O86_14610 [Delftia tsuruhatensis]
MATSTDLTRPYISYEKAFNRQITRAMDSQQVDVVVLTPREFLGVLQDRSRNDPRLAASLRAILAQSALGRYWTQTASPNAGKPWTIPASMLANDAYLFTRTLIALRLAGARTYVKATPKGTYIIITGRAGFRGNLLQGTRFLTTNPRMVQMGLGMRGLQGVARGGFILSLVVGIGVESLDFIFNDEKTMHDLVGGIGVEAVKAGLATMVGLGAGLVVGVGAATLAILPLVTMAVAVFLSGIALNKIDEIWDIKKNVIFALKMQTDSTPHGIYRINSNAVTEEKLNTQSERIKYNYVSSEPNNSLLLPINRKIDGYKNENKQLNRY